MDVCRVRAVERVRRVDRSSRIKARRTDEGYLVAPGSKLSGVGVQEYRRKDGSIQRDLRLPEEVFHKDAIASVEQQPVTLGHVFTDSKNARTHIRGVASNGRQDGDFLAGDLKIFDADTVDQAIDGAQEISLGYLADLEPIPGGVFRQEGHRFDGTEADFVQRNIRINHVALVHRGRANEGTRDRPVRLRLDESGHVLTDEENTMEMETIKIDGVDYQVPKASAPAVKATLEAASESKRKADQAEARADQAEQAANEAKEKADAAQAKLDAADQQTADQAERIEWATVASRAAQIFDKKIEDFADSDVATMRREMLKKLDDSQDFSEKPDAYIEAALDYRLQRFDEEQSKGKAPKRDQAAVDLQGMLKQPKEDAAKKRDEAVDSYRKRTLSMSGASGAKKGND